MSISLAGARAEASRINGARSRGPKTPEGKARSSRNALKHGFRAERFTVVGDEDEADYEAHEQALLEELAPEGALQSFLAERIARAAWRLARADCIEATLFDLHAGATGDLGLALVRDGNGTRAFETLLRYRGAAQAELMRALRTLKALQAEARAAAAAAPAVLPEPQAEPRARQKNPDEPERRRDLGDAGNSGEPARASDRADAAPRGSGLSPPPQALPRPSTVTEGAAPRAQPVSTREPIEPESLRNPGESAPPIASAADRARPRQGSAAPHA